MTAVLTAWSETSALLLALAWVGLRVGVEVRRADRTENEHPQELAKRTAEVDIGTSRYLGYIHIRSGAVTRGPLRGRPSMTGSARD